MATPTTLPASFTSGQVLTAAQMNDLRGAFRVLQVVSTEKVDTFTTTSTTYVTVTGLSVSITPSASSSKILVVAAVNGCQDVGVSSMALTIARGGTPIFGGTAAGSRYLGAEIGCFNQGITSGNTMVVLDSPATTSATTYDVRVRVTSGNGYINRAKDDSDTAGHLRNESTITVMEISA